MKLPTIAIDARLADGTNTGDSTYWTGLIHGLSSLEPNAKLLLYSNRIKPKTIPEKENFQWIFLPGRSSRWWSMVQFPLAARKAGATAIHTQYSLSPLSGSIGLTTIHDVSFFIGPEWFTKKDRTLLQLGVRSAVKRARKIFAVSNCDASEIETYLPDAKGKVVVTYNACPPWIERRDSTEARMAVKQEFGIDSPYLLTIGTRWPRKNMELAVDAVNRLSPDFPHKLAVIGKGNWEPGELGDRCVPTGYVSNEALSTLYSGAALYLAPSRHEGFGIPLLEAFRCACPVMCSIGGALPEVAGEAAYIERSWEAKVWAEDLERLLNDSSKLEALSDAGPRREKEFTWTQTARQTLEVYLNKDGDRR